MAQLPYLASTVLMGLLLAGVFVGVMRLFQRRGYSVRQEERSRTESVVAFLRTPTAWILGFILLVFVFGGGTILYVGGFLDAALVGTVGLLLAAAAAFVLSGYLVFGMYQAARGRGHTSAGAAGEALITLGLVFLVVIVLRLAVG
jgi:hypothetical protein